MTEYIKREDAIKALCEGCGLHECYTACDWREDRDRIEAISAEDAEPVRHGHWTKLFTQPTEDGGYYSWFECSACGNCIEYRHFVKDVIKLINPARYCSNCGTKMDEEEE